MVSSTWACNKNKVYKMSGCGSRDMFSFDVLEKGVGLASPPNFVYDFSRKIFLMFILLTDEILGKVCFTVYDVKNFEIKLFKIRTKIYNFGDSAIILLGGASSSENSIKCCDLQSFAKYIWSLLSFTEILDLKEKLNFTFWLFSNNYKIEYLVRRLGTRL